MLTLNNPYTTNALDIIAQGGLTYITGSNPNGIDIRSTCNQAEVQALSANAPTLIQAIPNGTGAVATDSPALDVVSTPGTAPGTLTTRGCPVLDKSAITSIDMGVGNFNARQLFISPDSSRAWVISDLPELLYLNMRLKPSVDTLCRRSDRLQWRHHSRWPCRYMSGPATARCIVLTPPCSRRAADCCQPERCQWQPCDPEPGGRAALSAVLLSRRAPSVGGGLSRCEGSHQRRLRCHPWFTRAESASYPQSRSKLLRYTALTKPNFARSILHHACECS